MTARVLALAGASGAGKSSIGELLVSRGGFELARSATTRECRRDGSADEYIYLSRAAFLEGVKRGEFLEYTEFSGNLYGTPLSEINRILASGKIPLLILDMNGIESLKRQSGIDAYSVYIYAPLSVLDERLDRRRVLAKTSPEQTGRRKRQNREDYRSLPEKVRLFDTFVENAEGCRESVADEVFTLFSENSKGKDFTSLAASLAKSVK